MENVIGSIFSALWLTLWIVKLRINRKMTRFRFKPNIRLNQLIITIANLKSSASTSRNIRYFDQFEGPSTSLRIFKILKPFNKKNLNKYSIFSWKWNCVWNKKSSSAPFTAALIDLCANRPSEQTNFVLTFLNNFVFLP